MNDQITAKERLSNPLKKWVREGVKELALSIVLLISILVVLTQSGGLI